MINQGKTGPVEIDVVSHNGYCWIKVKAMNPQTLDQLCKGEGEFGSKSVIDSAKELLELAKFYPFNYQNPYIVFRFTSGVTQDVREELQSLGVVV